MGFLIFRKNGSFFLPRGMWAKFRCIGLRLSSVKGGQASGWLEFGRHTSVLDRAFGFLGIFRKEGTGSCFCCWTDAIGFFDV